MTNVNKISDWGKREQEPAHSQMCRSMNTPRGQPAHGDSGSVI